jgi:hypothetical protein
MIIRTLQEARKHIPIRKKIHFLQACDFIGPFRMTSKVGLGNLTPSSQVMFSQTGFRRIFGEKTRTSYSQNREWVRKTVRINGLGLGFHVAMLKS